MGKLVTVHAEIDLYDIDTDILMEELERRGEEVKKAAQQSTIFLEPVVLTAERHELDVVRARALSGDMTPAAEMLLNLLRDATGRAI